MTLVRADERNWRGPVARLCELPPSGAEHSVARRTSLCAARAELAQARRLSRTSGASNSFANPLQARQDDTHWFCSHRYGKGTDICGLDVRNKLSLWSFLWWEMARSRIGGDALQFRDMIYRSSQVRLIFDRIFET